LGVPLDKIRSDDRSRNTAENALFSARLLRQSGLKRVLLVTSCLHLRRAEAVFRKAGFVPPPGPGDPVTDGLVLDVFGVDTLQRPLDFPDILIPEASALDRSFRVLSEIAGYLYYGLAGRL
jgi:uncharacterized SAM-binding protein YcdF (DUF218 family)